MFEWVGCEWVGVYVSGLVGAMKWKIVLRPLKMPFVVCNIELYWYLVSHSRKTLTSPTTVQSLYSVH